VLNDQYERPCRTFRSPPATLAQLVRIVSSATGVPLPTVVDIDRKLVKARLRAKADPGFNARA
jgi:hypothetical protein